MSSVLSSAEGYVANPTVRGWAAGAVVGGLILVAAGIVEAAGGSPAVTDLLLAAGILVTIAGTVAIQLGYGARYGLLGTIAAIATGAGQLLQAASAASGVVTGDPDHGLSLILFVAGSILFLLGLIGLTIAIFTAKAGYRWLGLLLVAGVLASGAAQQYGGTSLFGAAWIAVGCLLLTRQR